jgi:hypothetical protein
LSPITVEYRDGTLEEAQECSFCVQLKAEQEEVREMLMKEYNRHRKTSNLMANSHCMCGGWSVHVNEKWGDHVDKAIRQLDLTALSDKEGK